MKKEYLDYKPELWDKAFISERNNLIFALPDFKMNIEHIGATSVNSGRSFRNVDILLSVSNFADIYTIAMLLETKGYKEIRELSTLGVVVLVKQKKVNRQTITLRVVQYGEEFYRRALAFKTLLQESSDRIQRYNIFREELIKEVNLDIASYNKTKYEYINNLVDEHFKFEK